MTTVMRVVSEGGDTRNVTLGHRVRLVDMSSDVVPLGDDEVAVVPVESSDGLALALGKDLADLGDPVPRSLVQAAIDKGGLLGGAMAAKPLLDGSMVRLAPETVQALKNGSVFARDAKGMWLGTLRNPGSPGFTGAVRMVPRATQPAAAGLILQTMAVQHQLGQIQRALETVNAKLDLLLQGRHYEVLADLAVITRQLDELRSKAADGHELTSQDEIKIRDYEDVALGRRQEAVLWLGALRELLDATSLPLKEHHQRLEELLDRHVAFWVRAYVTSQLALASAQVLRLFRATTSEPEQWVEQLHRTVRSEIGEITYELTSLTTDLDAYLRRADIARGIEELSVARKRKVRRLRRDLWRTQEELRTSLEEVLPQLPTFNERPLPGLPAPLEAHVVEPQPVRERVQTARSAATRNAKQAGVWAGAHARSRINRAGRAVQERRSATDDQDGSGS
jgi:hypothetical protein